MRILTISSSYSEYYYGSGGVAAHVGTLVQALYKEDPEIRVYVLTHNDEGPIRDDRLGKAEKGTPYIFRSCFDRFITKDKKRSKSKLTGPSPGKRAPYESALSLVIDNWTKINPNIIHVHDYDSLVIGMILKNAYNIPLVFTRHYAPTKWMADKHKSNPKDCFLKFIHNYNVVDHIVVPSSVSQHVLEEIGFTKEVVKVIKHGIDYNKLINGPYENQSLLSEYGLDNEDIKVILCPTRVDPHKNPDILLKAIEFIIKDRETRKIKFFLTYDRKEENRSIKNLTNMVKHIIPGDLIIEKLNNDADMPILYKRANVCVIPSIRESFSLTALEAFAFKVPVVASNSSDSALSKIITNNKNGLLYDTGSPDDLAKKVNMLLDNDELSNRLTREGSNLLYTEYNAERMAKDYINLYQGILLNPAKLAYKAK